MAFSTAYFGKSRTQCQCVKSNKEGKVLPFTYPASWSPLRKRSEDGLLKYSAAQGPPALPPALEAQMGREAPLACSPQRQHWFGS